jgi:hypothetical protein
MCARVSLEQALGNYVSQDTCFANKVLMEHSPIHLSTYLSTAVFGVSRAYLSSWYRGCIWFAEPKILTVWPFTEYVILFLL